MKSACGSKGVCNDQEHIMSAELYGTPLNPRQLHVNATRLNTNSADGQAAGGYSPVARPVAHLPSTVVVYIHGKRSMVRAKARAKVRAWAGAKGTARPRASARARARAS